MAAAAMEGGAGHPLRAMVGPIEQIRVQAELRPLERQRVVNVQRQQSGDQHDGGGGGDGDDDPPRPCLALRPDFAVVTSNSLRKAPTKASFRMAGNCTDDGTVSHQQEC
jgi:hypothetical protein